MNKKTSSQILSRTLVAPLMMAIPLFIPAGRLDYWQGWVYIGLKRDSALHLTCDGGQGE